MAQATNYKRSLRGSIGAGMGSIFGGSGKTYYILEHKVSSKYHKAGESQPIIVDQIEMGRDPKCQVRFDESFSTVSRRHAAIVKSGDRWKIVQLSSTNSTFLNGKKIQDEWYLQNGDEIQLAVNGPKLGFIVPTGNKATVGSIGLSRRLSLFGQQALRPYKLAITALSVLLVLIIAGGFGWEWKKANEWNAEKNRLETALAEAKDPKLIDSLRVEIVKLSQRRPIVQVALPNTASIKGAEGTQPNTGTKDSIQQQNNPAISVAGVSDISSCNPYVYAIFLDNMNYELPNGDTYSFGDNRFIGTGFMLNDGRFVTARHVVEPWYYYPYFSENASEMYKKFNYASFNEGKISAKYTVVSPTGKRYSFTNEQFICNRANDRISKEEDYELGTAIFRTSAYDRYDWAYYQTNATNGLKYDNALSVGLQQGTPLSILGYFRGLVTEDINNIQPIYTACVTTGNGLNSNGLILSSGDDSAGNSGSPVFVKIDDGYVVVGLFTGAKQIAGQRGVIVPISEVKR